MKALIDKALRRRVMGDNGPSPLPNLAETPGATRIELPQLTRHRVCNPSILRLAEGGFRVMLRGCNYDIDTGHGFFTGSALSKVPDTQNYLVDLDADLTLRDMRFAEDRHIRAETAALDGIEDFRLFEWQGETWALGTALNFAARTNVMVLCRLDGHVLADPVFLRSPQGAKMEKNWTPAIVDGALTLIYTHRPLRLLTYRNGALRETALRDAPASLQGYSGSSCALPYGNGFVSVVHRYRSVKDLRWRVYEHRVVEYGPNLSIRRVGQPFRFEEDGVEFCAGLALASDGVILSYGVRDRKAVLLRISHDAFAGLLA